MIKCFRSLVRSYSTSNSSIDRLSHKGNIRREPSQPIPGRQPKIASAEEAVSVITSNNTVFIHGGSATPIHLVNAMSKHGRSNSLSNVKLVHIHTRGKFPVGVEYCGIFKDTSLFIGENVRDAALEGRADYIPVFLSEISQLFYRNVINIDVALVHVCPPGIHGFCSIGVSVDCTIDALRTAAIVIGQINKNMPRTYGDGQIHISHFDYIVNHDELLPG